MLRISQKYLDENQPDDKPFVVISKLMHNYFVDFYKTQEEASKVYDHTRETCQVYCGLSVDYQLYC